MGYPGNAESLIAVNVADRAFARRRVHESRVIRHEPEVFGIGFNFAQIHRPDRAVFARNGIGFAGAVVNDGRLFCGIEVPPYARAEIKLFRANSAPRSICNWSQNIRDDTPALILRQILQGCSTARAMTSAERLR